MINNKRIFLVKFGGSSLETKESIKKLFESYLNFIGRKPIILVVSAFSKVTSKLETIALDFLKENDTEKAFSSFSEILEFHLEISRHYQLDLLQKDFDVFKDEFYQILDSEFSTEEKFVNKIMEFGEVFASLVVFNFLKKQQKDNFVYLKDAREYIFCDFEKVLQDRFVFGDCRIKKEKTSSKLSTLFTDTGIDWTKNPIIVFPGFIAANGDNLGKNGSDTTLAIIAESCKNNSFNPSVMFVKGVKLEGLNGSLPVLIQEICKLQKGREQPYIHPDALHILAKESIPFIIENGSRVTVFPQ